MPIPTRLARPPEPKVGSGPSGPSEERVRELRDIRRRQLAGKAKEAGTDPGAGSTMAETGYSRSSSTQEQYLARGRILLNRYRVENDIHAASRDDVNPVDFVNWLLSMKPTLRPSTWRLYRLSVATTISALPHEETEAALSLLETDVVVHTRKKDRKKTDDAATEPLPSRRTSAGKEKRLPKDSFDKLTNYLRTQSRSQMAPVIRDWLIAGVWTGLRPNEWRMTDLEFRDDPAAPNGHRAWLYVLNAKATNGRGNGVVRTIDLSGVSREIVEAIQRMSERGARWAAEGSYIKTQKYCSQMLFRICERLFPHATRSFCFYSCRHQFVANMKSLMSPEEVSAMVGHGITMTAAENYGLRRSAWSAEDITERPAPVPEEVSLVKQRMGFFDERMRQRVAAGLTVPDLGQEEGEAISYPIG